MSERKGCIQVYTGSGKGKTTASLGLGLRAHGNGMKVHMVQFMKGGRYGRRIAHGTLLVGFMSAASARLYLGRTASMGYDKVRFINPVLSGKRVRAHAVTSAVELKGNAVNATRTFTVEIEGEEKPALVAEWIGRTVYDS